MLIVQVMPQFGLAGAEIMCENLTYELVKLGHKVIIISLFDFHSALTDRLESNGIKIIYLNKRLGLDFSMFFKLRRIFVDLKPDVIHSHLNALQYSLPAAVMAKVKRRVHTVHNVAQKENTNIARKLNKIFFKHFNVIPVALSEMIQQTIIDEYKLNKERIPVVYNGIDLEKCIQKNDYTIKDMIRILHVGRFADQKNHIGLLKAFKEFLIDFPNSELLLVGDGEKRSEIEEYIIKNGISNKVKLLGVQKDVYPIMNESDIFILPSLYEGFPMTILEAMGTGLPVIASRVGGVPDIICNSQNGILTSLEINEIVEALKKLSGNQSMREFIGINAIKRADDFSARKMAEKYCEIYES